MDMAIKTRFIESWKWHFNGAELPITFYYTNAEDAVERVATPAAHMCMIGVLAKVRKSASLKFDVDSIGCAVGKRYTGFVQGVGPTFEYFLSCGIPGMLEGERYKNPPSLLRRC
jgi:hypothetical protein